MDLYIVAVQAVNELVFHYNCLALTDQQAVSICFRYHNRQHGGEPAFRATRKSTKVISKRRLRPGVLDFQIPTLK